MFLIIELHKAELTFISQATSYN
uniref:Uncharacterized protein n=1 Tax=Anguilla anguilla TaxID=7936 RepID=A0A0E9UMI3_ANGAN